MALRGAGRNRIFYIEGNLVDTFAKSQNGDHDDNTTAIEIAQGSDTACTAPPQYAEPVPPPDRVLEQAAELVVNRTSRALRAQECFRTYADEALDDFDKKYCRTQEMSMVNVWGAWQQFITNILPMANPAPVWYGLCHNEANAKRVCQAFLRDLVETSVTYRPTLTSEDWQPVRTLTTAKAVQGIWRNLITHANRTILRDKRLEDPANAKTWSLIYREDARNTGPIAQIHKWIANQLALTVGLSLDQTFTKREATEEDVMLLIKTIWTCPADIPCVPRTRVAFHAALLVLALGGFRPGTVMGIAYRDIDVGLVQLSSGELRLKATITIRHNKRPLGVTKQTQNDVVSFTITFVDCKPICLMSLIIGQALADNAFEGDFTSLGMLLETPRLGNQRYLQLRWKERMLSRNIFDMSYPNFLQLWNRTQLVAGVRDGDQFRPYAIRVAAGNRIDAAATDSMRCYILSNGREMFDKSYHARHIPLDLHRVNFGEKMANDATEEILKLLRRATLRCDPQAPLYISEADRQAFEGRPDVKRFRKEYAAVSEAEGCGSVRAQQLNSQTSNLLSTLADLKLAEDREAYFDKIDELRSVGKPTTGIVSPKSPVHRPGRLRRCGGSYIGKFLDCAELGGEERLCKYVELITTYVCLRPAGLRAIVTQLWPQPGDPSLAALEQALDSPLVRPSGREGTSGKSWCLFGCGDFCHRTALTSHVLSFHAESFAIPFACPECVRLGRDPVTISDPTEWSNHTERRHGRLNSPRVGPGRVGEMREHRTKKYLRYERVNCLLCPMRLVPGAAFSRHFNKWHLSELERPLVCPTCFRGTMERVQIDGVDAWMRHAREVHHLDSQRGARLDEHGEAEKLPHIPQRTTTIEDNGDKIKCLLCFAHYTPGSAYTIHFAKKHKAQFKEPMEPLACPTCHREGRQVLVEGLASWIRHARTVHSFNNDARPRAKSSPRRVRNLWQEGGQSTLQAALNAPKGRHALPGTRRRVAVMHKPALESSGSDTGEETDCTDWTMSDEDSGDDTGQVTPMPSEPPRYVVSAFEPAFTDTAAIDPRLLMSGPSSCTAETPPPAYVVSDIHD